MVRFDREDQSAQNIRLLADPTVATGLVRGEHRARGALIFDFCVPEQGESTCAIVGNPAASDIVVNITFEYGSIARVTALGPTAYASYSASGSVIDLERNAFVNFESLSGISASRGSIKTVAKVPVPVPDIDSEEITQPVTFTAVLRRGKTYRFQLAAATYVNVGFLDSDATVSDSSNEFGLFPFLGGGRTTLRNLTIRVGSDPAELEGRIEDLEELTEGLQSRVGELSEQLENIRATSQDEHASLRSRIDELARLLGPDGSVLMLPAGTDHPDGYTYIGIFDLAPSGSSRGRSNMMQVDVYLKDPEEVGSLNNVAE